MSVEANKRYFELQNRDWLTATIPLRSMTRVHGFSEPLPLVREVSTFDAIDAVESFCRRVSGILDADYGDWMRRANRYLLNLSDEVGFVSPEVRHLFVEMQDTIQFNPDFSIVETEQKLIRLAMQMELAFGGHAERTPDEYGVEMVVPEDFEEHPPGI